MNIEDVWSCSSTAGYVKYRILKYCTDRGIRYSFDDSSKCIELDAKKTWLYNDIRDFSHFKLDYDLVDELCKEVYDTIQANDINNIYNVTLTKINGFKDKPPMFGVRFGYLK